MNKNIRDGYYPEINIARGIAVLCVIFGHSFPDLGQEITNSLAHYLVDLVYSFHMGLFFFFAGFVSSRKLIRGEYILVNVLKKKMWHLRVPYIFYSLIGLLIKTFGAKYSTTPFSPGDAWKILIGVSPNVTMWFLWTLLIISILYFCTGKLLAKKNAMTNTKCWIYICVGLIFLLFSYIFPDSIIDNFLKFTTYYAFGVVIANKYESIKTRFSHTTYLIFGVLALAMFIVFTSVVKTEYFVTCCLAIYFVMLVSYLLVRNKGIVRKSLDMLGKYSYDLYLISYFVQRPIRYLMYRKVECPYAFTVLIMFLLGTVVTLVVSKYLLRKIKLVRYIALGEVWFQ